MPGSPVRVDETEDCEELDEDYFLSLGQTFSVVDTWNENDEIQVKKDPDEESNHSKASSRRSNKDLDIKRTSKSRDPRSRDFRSNIRPERIRISPDRRRSPDRNRVISPRRSPERNRNFRDDNLRFRKSPPRMGGQFDRRRPPSPERNRNPNAPPKKSFLEEVQEKLMKEGKRDPQIEHMIQHGGRIDLNNEDLRPEPNFQNRPMHFNNQPNMPVFMNEQMMPQQFNPMMIQQMPTMQMFPPNMMNMHYPPMNIGPPIPTNIYSNPLQIMDAPKPVPPPQVDCNYPPGVEAMQVSPISPPILYNNNSNNGMPRQPVTRENVERPPRKKTPNQPPAVSNLIDMLRKKSKQNNKTPEDELASKKAKVLERCKEAVKFISDWEQNKSKVPLTCVIPNQSLQKPNDTINRSPLLTSAKNPQFLFQATPSQCASVLENHPLRNIYGETAEIAQHLKMDLHELSSIVERESIIRQPNEDPVIAVASSSSSLAGPSKSNNNNVNNNHVNKKTSTKGAQTEPLTCKKCHQLERVKQSARSKICQTDEVTTVDSGVQCDESNEEGGFRVFIDAQTMADRNFEQHHALEVFSRAFGIPCHFVDSKKHQERVVERRQVPEERDERLNFTNPTNPNMDENPDFFSTSPIPKRSNSPQSRFKQSNSPPPRVRNSPRVFRNSNSPPRVFRNSKSPPRDLRGRPQRSSVFERIGEKISDHSDSPRNYDNWDDDFNDRPSFRPYTIPSPHIVPARERSRSPGPSRRYRNKSRSLSRSRSRSPKRYRGGNKLLSRRGRY